MTTRSTNKTAGDIKAGTLKDNSDDDNDNDDCLALLEQAFAEIQTQRIDSA